MTFSKYLVSSAFETTATHKLADRPCMPLSFETAYWHTSEALESVYGQSIGHGRHREVYGSARWVFKVPNCIEGIEANLVEAELYAENPARRAECFIDRAEGLLPVLVMRRVRSAHGEMWPRLHNGTPNGEDPDETGEVLRSCEDWSWAHKIECAQVGYCDHTGTVVAYDYADSVDECRLGAWNDCAPECEDEAA